MIVVLLKQYQGIGFFFGVLFVVIVFSALEANGGQTPGKRLLGLEVRYLDGTPCDLRACDRAQRASASSTGSRAST